MAEVAGLINKRVKAELRKSTSKGGWTYVLMPDSAAFFGTRGLGKAAAWSTVSISKRVHGPRRLRVCPQERT
jgi:hypothetical protein